MNRLGVNGPEEVKNHPWIKKYPWDKLLKKEIEPLFKPPVYKLFFFSFLKKIY